MSQLQENEKKQKAKEELNSKLGRFVDNGKLKTIKKGSRITPYFSNICLSHVLKSISCVISPYHNVF